MPPEARVAPPSVASGRAACAPAGSVIALLRLLDELDEFVVFALEDVEQCGGDGHAFGESQVA